MSKYTTELRYICEVKAEETDSVGYDDVQSVIDNSWDKIFSFDFPIFDENYREPLCKKIIKHYYTREIAEETFGLWKLRLDSRMNEIMPYFNKLYNSELITIAPLVNYRVATTRNETKGGTDGIVDSGSEAIMGSSGNTRVTTGGYTDTHSGTDTTVKSGNETLGMAGKESNTRSGKDELTKTGKETSTKNGTDELEKKGKETDTKDGTRTLEKIGAIEDKAEFDGTKQNTHQVKSGTLDTEVIDLFSDTPQGDIHNMGTSYSGASHVPIVGENTAYLTTANKTTTNENDTRIIEDKTSFTDYSETNTKTYKGEDGQHNFRELETFDTFQSTKEFTGRKDVRTYTNVTDELSFTNRKDTREYTDLKDEKSFENRVDTKTYNNVTNAETKNLTDSRVYNNETITDTGNTSKSTTKGNNRTITYGNTNDYLESVLGSKGKSDAELLMEFRKSFLNIDEMIIKQLSDLFINLW